MSERCLHWVCDSGNGYEWIHFEEARTGLCDALAMAREEEEEEWNASLSLACGIEFWWCLSWREEAVVEDQVWEI